VDELVIAALDSVGHGDRPKAACRRDSSLPTRASVLSRWHSACAFAQQGRAAAIASCARPAHAEHSASAPVDFHEDLYRTGFREPNQRAKAAKTSTTTIAISGWKARAACRSVIVRGFSAVDGLAQSAYALVRNQYVRCRTMRRIAAPRSRRRQRQRQSPRMRVRGWPGKRSWPELCL
jgi:hypothetical protein